MIPGSLLRGSYVIPKAALDSKQQRSLKHDLTVLESDLPGFQTQKTNKRPFSRMQDYPKQDGYPRRIFLETETHFVVPRFYGLTHFGVPETTETSSGLAFVTPDLKCTLVPRKSKKQDVAISRGLCTLNTGPGFGGILALPCGYGKTAVALYLALQLQRKTLILVPDTFILEQWRQRIQVFVPAAKVGVLQQDTIEIENRDLILGMIHSLAKRNYPKDLLNQIGFLVFDECHHCCTPLFSRVFHKIHAKYRLGLTATPNHRTVAKENQWTTYFLGPVFFAPERPKDSDLTVHMITYTNPDKPLKEIKTKRGEPLMHLMLKQMIEDRKRNALVLSLIVQSYRNPYRSVLVLSKRLSQMAFLKKELIQRYQVPEDDIGLVQQSIKLRERPSMLQRRIVLAIEKLGKEALDAPHLNTLVFATPMTKIEQPTGRIQRAFEEAEELVIDSAKQETPPLVYYVVDPVGIFQGMAYKNYREWKSKYTVIWDNQNGSDSESGPFE